MVSQSKRLMNLIFGLGQCFLVEKSMFSGFCFYFQPVQMMSFEGKMRRPFQSCSSELCQAGTFKVSVAPGVSSVKRFITRLKWLERRLITLALVFLFLFDLSQSFITQHFVHFCFILSCSTLHCANIFTLFSQ